MTSLPVTAFFLAHDTEQLFVQGGQVWKSFNSKMEDFLDRISRDPSLREAVRSQLGLSAVSMEDSQSHRRVINPSDALSVSSQLASMSSQPVVYTLNSMNQQAGIADTPSSHQSDSNNSPLAAQVHQSGANMNNPLAARVNLSGSIFE